MVNLALALQENQSKDHFVLVNAKMTNFLMTKEIAILVAATKLFLQELVLAQLVIHAIHAECALFHVGQVSLCSKELVQYAHLTLSSTQLLMVALVLKGST